MSQVSHIIERSCIIHVFCRIEARYGLAISEATKCRIP